MDEKPITIWIMLKELAAVLLMLGCFYLFFLGASGYFDDRPDPVKRKPVEISTSQGRDYTSGHGYYLRRAERGR